MAPVLAALRGRSQDSNCRGRKRRKVVLPIGMFTVTLFWATAGVCFNLWTLPLPRTAASSRCSWVRGQRREQSVQSLAAGHRSNGVWCKMGSDNADVEADEDSVQIPPVSFLAAMAAAGASLGPVLDGFHSRFGVLQYHNPAPFAVQLGTFELCQTAAWVPPLFGVAGLLIGTLYVLFDQVLETSSEQRDLSAGVVALNIALYIGQYFVSGLIFGPFGIIGPGQPSILRAAELLMWIWALTQWRVFDNSRAGLLVAALTAVGGPGIEIGLLNFPGSDLYAYNAPDLLGIPTFILPVYFCGAPAVGCLARYVLKITTGVAPSASVNRPS